MTTPMNVENYHLKWDSHLSYLNLSVSTLFKNEKFADVMLLTSNPEGGSGIPAHRIILSSCSHFFASIFEVTPSTPNSIIYIVLPPELSRRSIQILVQYMYSGEATVSNDILSEVLRGGEILKIRGLYRSSNSNNSNQNSHSVNEHKNSHQYSSIQRGIELGCCARSEQDKQPELRGLGASATVLPKESPVIVRSPKPAQHAPSNGPLNLSSGSQSSQNISVKKDVAIDPDENCLSSMCYGNGSFHKATQHIPENLCKNFSGFPDRLMPPDRDRGRRHSEDVTLARDDCGSLLRNLRDEEPIQRIDRRRTSLPEVISSFANDRSKHISEQDRHPEGDIPEPLNFLTIKQEPIEWQSDADNENNVLSGKPPPPLDIIKTEVAATTDDDGQTDKEEEEEMVYSPLSCELCGETFTIPKEWVRHIENHMDCKTSYVPKKKRRISTNSSDLIPSLKCDLCATQYVTPAEWVRHIQTEHTERELAMCNNKHGISSFKKKSSMTANAGTLEYLKYLGKTCDICNKKFPSYASMVIHSRTHTGEKPFHCSPCNKGFNVKSNLLRHMRTLHNQLGPSTSVSDDNPRSPNGTECKKDIECEIEKM